MNAAQAGEEARSIFDQFADCHPSLSEGALSDFSGQESEARFCRVAPRTAQAVCQIMARANALGTPVRMRAQGHSLNGSSLPKPGELSVSIENLREVRFEESGTVTVGCGVVLWILQNLVRRQGFDLPVLNDGYPGPSVGGFIASGGFGPRSALFGGFWNNVIDVGLVDGCGNPHRIARGHPLFPWLFGSMGQLGICVDAKLAIVPREERSSPAYPRGVHIVAPQLIAPKVPPEFAIEGDERLFWFTLFVPDQSIDDAHRELKRLEQRHSGVLRFQERYRYPIAARDIVAPLVYPFARPFTATGAWGWLTDTGIDRLAKLRDFDAQFMELAASQPDYRRYVQSEMAMGPAIYQRCFGPEVHALFLRLKGKLDPKGLYNRGSVFKPPEIARPESLTAAPGSS